MNVNPTKGAILLESQCCGISPCSRSGFPNWSTIPPTTSTASRTSAAIPAALFHDVVGRRNARKLRRSSPSVIRKRMPRIRAYWISPRMLVLHRYATSFGGELLLSCDAYATVDMSTISVVQPARRQFMKSRSGDRLPGRARRADRQPRRVAPEAVDPRSQRPDHTGVEQRHFTTEEANEALGEVRPLTEELVGHRRALVELQERQAAITTRIAGNGGNVEPHELEDVQGRLDEEVTGIARCVARIHETGALVKDLDAGLVDFPATRDGEEILLCWRLGEDEIGFWHGLEEGFSGRKPL
ncbi:MAG: DUF2203 family protein [Actinobacteria bacterium]|nr:MAG: DUF2203 family protein [Actinomycetota bacterium]